MIYKNKNFLVYGMQRSGIAVAKLLNSLGANVYIFDDDNAVYETAGLRSLIEKGCKIADFIDENGGNYEERKNSGGILDVVVVSPGVKIDTPILVDFKRRNVRIIGEVELGYLNCKAPIIAVSGTNGKTTVSTLIHEGLSKGGEGCYLLGNVGYPFCEYANDCIQSDAVVLEVSSFQLETCHLLTPHIGVMLNVTEDHLDRHYTMENYIYLKKRLFQNMRESEVAVLNYDDPIVRSFADDLKCKVVWFSTRKRVEGGNIAEGYITYFGEKILPLDDLGFLSGYESENALATVCVLKLYGIENQVIAETLSNFKGVAFRCENVGEYDGITYFNDSKSTNVVSTVKAVEKMTKNTVLILGGKDKNQDFTTLFELLKERKDVIKSVVLNGENRYELLNTAIKAGYTEVLVTDNLLSAVSVAKAVAKEGDAILFSPGTSSFDAYKNFEERGERFNYIVKGLNEKED